MFVDIPNGSDVMQVCLNGHVITDRLTSAPESGRTHCHRCGAATLDHCCTCGSRLPGVVPVPDLVPIGSLQAPRYCATCGAAFPWVRRPRAAPRALKLLESHLRRLPLMIRQLRWRQGDQPPFRVENERDLEDLVRAVLSLHFDDVRLESRTPRYSPRTRTDFFLPRAKAAITVKYARSDLREPQLRDQWQEDIAYYRARPGCRMLLGFIYDPEGLLQESQILQKMLSESAEGLGLRSIVAGQPDLDSRIEGSGIPVGSSR
jgi:REase_DpnII-MboI/Uncharacterized protein conserved in bacteria (DUF2321)